MYWQVEFSFLARIKYPLKSLSFTLKYITCQERKTSRMAKVPSSKELKWTLNGPWIELGLSLTKINSVEDDLLEHGGLPHVLPLDVRISYDGCVEGILLFGFFCGTPPWCLKVMGWVVVVVASRILVSSQGLSLRLRLSKSLSESEWVWVSLRDWKPKCLSLSLTILLLNSTCAIWCMMKWWI